MKIYNGEGLILGRLASFVAKDLLLGEDVNVVHCEKIVISGAKADTLARQKQRRERKGHPDRSQSISRLPELFVKRSIRGMLPWRQARGRDAYKHLKCYRGLPASFLSEQLITLPKESVRKLPTLKHLTVGEICVQLGGKR